MDKRDATYDKKWDAEFYELTRFKAKYGHCDVPQNKKPYIKLTNWCGTQRNWKKYRPAQYDPDRIRKLNEIGFSWSMQEKWFTKNLQKLKEFIDKNGHSFVVEADDKVLSKWCAHLRDDSRVKDKRITKEKIKLLDNIGFDWNSPRKAFVEIHFKNNIEELQRFVAKNGRYPLRKDKKRQYLNTWVEKLRMLRKQGILSAEKIKLLNDAKFCWHPAAERWEASYRQLLLYKQKFGHCNVSVIKKDKESYKLFVWCFSQRRALKRGEKSLTKDRIERLNEIGFLFDISKKPPKTSENELLENLRQLNSELGRTPVLRDLKTRGRFRKGKYARFGTYQKALIKAGMNNSDEDFWLRNFNKLSVSFANKIKDGNGGKFRLDRSRNRQLSLWVSNQRQLYRRGHLLPSRIELLASINFPWRINGTGK